MKFITNVNHSKWLLVIIITTTLASTILSIPLSFKDKAKLENLGSPYLNYQNQTNSANKIQQPIVWIPMPSRECNNLWNYKHHGNDWECLCSEGKQQSPINLPSKEAAIKTPIKPFFTFFEVEPIINKYDNMSTYLLSQMSQTQLGSPMNIILQDNTLKIFHSQFGKAVTLNGAVYAAQEITFHTPSEHTIENKVYDMEMQVTFFGQSVGDIAKQIVLCFLIEKAPGVYNKFFDDIDIYDLPSYENKKKPLTKTLYIPKIFYGIHDTDIPSMKPFSFYTYQGSNTSPPCNENTIVYVASEPIPLGNTVVDLFQQALTVPQNPNNSGFINSNQFQAISSINHNMYEEERIENNRFTQPMNGRPVFYYDHYENCDWQRPRDKNNKQRGHYEKYVKAQAHYIYVDGEEPSGLPGALVVHKKEAWGDFNLK